MVVINVNITDTPDESERIIDIKIESTYGNKLDFLLTEEEFQECISLLYEYAAEEMDGKINIVATPTGIVEYFFSSYPYIEYKEYKLGILVYQNVIQKYSVYESNYETFFANFPRYASERIEQIYLKILSRLNEKQREIQQEIQQYRQIENKVKEVVNSMELLTKKLEEIYAKAQQIDKRIEFLERKQEEQKSKLRKFIDFLKNPFRYIIPKIKKEKELEKQRLQEEMERLKRERDALDKQRKEFMEKLQEERKRLEELEMLREKLEEKSKRKGRGRGLGR